MPPVIFGAVAAASIFLAYRMIKRVSERAVLRQQAMARRTAPVDTLVRDPHTGVYRPSSLRDPQS